MLREVLTDMEIPNYLHPFTALSAGDTYVQVKKRILHLKEIGVRSMNLLWSGKDGGDEANGTFTPFNSDTYWTRIRWVAEICREEGMTFMMQDAAPFPTGLADGFLEREEHLDLNKLYLGERHLDVKGPVADGAFLVSQLVGSIRCTDQERGFGRARPFPGDALYAVVAVRRGRDALEWDTAADITEKARDGLLVWDVPEGIWRIFVLFETRNDGGRMFYMNLLDEESVALNIRAIYEPHYEHLKDVAGTTWLGFFYDEAEIGNLQRYCSPVLPGTARNAEGESMALPWSGQMEKRWREHMRTEEMRAEEMSADWKITLQDGTVFRTGTLININGAAYAPAYVGTVVYETETDWEQTPDFLHLGAVYEIASVYVNGKSAGTAQNTPYCFDIRGLAVPGKNSLRIEVRTGTARDMERPDCAAFGRSMSADVYNVLEPGGLLGPVRVLASICSKQDGNHLESENQ